MLSLWMGTAIVGRYVLIGPVGYGGVSVVYQAIDTHRGSRCAVKLLSPAFADDEYARQRVRQEALITTRLRHPSVPQVFDYGDATLPDGRLVPYVAMELLSGAMLAGRLAGGALPWPEAVRVAATIADVLAIAHRRGVVHRDLTPANIMMTESGPKIIDFGEAIAIEAISVLAEEQPLPTRRVSSAADPADDVYALGVLLYQMLTGHSPYQTSSTEAQLHAARLRHIAPTPVLLVPGLPRTVAEVCRACMAKRPEERPVAAQIAIALWALVIDPADAAAARTAEEQLSSGPQPRLDIPGQPARPPAPEPEPLRPPGGSGTHRRAARRPFAAVRPAPYSTGSG
jgi:serine/threonine-protein kinase